MAVFATSAVGHPRVGGCALCTIAFDASWRQPFRMLSLEHDNRDPPSAAGCFAGSMSRVGGCKCSGAIGIEGGGDDMPACGEPAPAEDGDAEQTAKGELMRGAGCSVAMHSAASFSSCSSVRSTDCPTMLAASLASMRSVTIARSACMPLSASSSVSLAAICLGSSAWVAVQDVRQHQ